MNSAIRALTIRSNGGLLRILKSDVEISIPFLGDPSLHEQKPKTMRCLGIWDTGATGTVITEKVVQGLDLKVTGKKMVSTANGVYSANTYLVNVILPSDVHIQHVEVTEGKLPEDSDLLIGMDIITLRDFSITNQGGSTVMSFRTPSCHEVDFVQRVQEKNRQQLRNHKR